MVDVSNRIARGVAALLAGGFLALTSCSDELVSDTDEPFGLRTLDEGLLLHWTFDDRDGNQILDVSGNGRHGNLLGGGSFVIADNSEAVQLDGIDDYISFAGPRNPSLYGGAEGAVTISARVRVSDVAEYNTLCVGCGPVRSMYVGTQGFGNAVQASMRDASSGGLAWSQSTDALTNDAWVQATMIVEGGVGTRFYFDCALDSELLDPDVALADFGYSAVGQGAFPHMWYEGEIDDFRVWDRALEPEEIGALCPADPLAEGLEVHWTFEDRSGNQVLDISGNDRHGTLRGGGTFVAGMVGDAVSLDGVDDYLSFVGPRNPALYGGVNGAFTVSSRVRLSDLAKYNSLCYGCGPFRSMFVGTAPSGARAMAALLDQGTGGLTWPWSTPGIDENAWTEVTMVVEGSVGTRFYLDCALDSEDLDSSVGLGDYGYSSVGQGGVPGQWFQGEIDELRIWNRALSAGEIGTMCPVDPLDEGLEMHWSFEDRTGNTILDLSGNGRDGTMIGGGFVPSPHGEAASLDGVDDRISFVGPRDVALYGGTTGDYTMSAEVRAWDVRKYNALCFGCGPAGNFYFGSLDELTPYDLGNRAIANLYNGFSFLGGPETDLALDSNLWFAVTLVVEGGVGSRIYLNGVLRGELIDPTTQLADPGFSAVGQSVVANRWFGGEIDQLRIWSRALSEEEVSSFGAGNPRLHRDEIVHWNLNQHSGRLVLDTSESGHSALLEGAEIVPSPQGQAARFDGVDDFMTFPAFRDPELYGGVDGAFTLTTRVRVDDVDSVNTLCFGCGPFSSLSVGPLLGGNRAWARLFDENSPSFIWPTTTPALTSDEWVEITLTVDATVGARFYLDCQLVGELLDPDIGLHDFGYSSFGEGAGGTWFQGDLEEFWMWSRVLPDNEIAALCQ